MTVPIPAAGRLALCALAVSCATAASAAAAPIPLGELRGFLAPDFASAAGAPAPSFAALLPPAVELRSVLRMVHLLGLCLGFGTALSLDLNTLVWLRSGRVPPGAAEMLRGGERLVAVGFALLWASGIALAALAVRADPAFLGNPKLWAKVLIVLALTANALALHGRILPAFSASLARPLNGNWRGRERRLFMLGGAVSASSWGMAFALGVLREWNYAADARVILALWLLAMAAAFLAIRLLFPRPGALVPYDGLDRRAARRRARAAAAPAPALRPAAAACP